VVGTAANPHGAYQVGNHKPAERPRRYAAELMWQGVSAVDVDRLVLIGLYRLAPKMLDHRGKIQGPGDHHRIGRRFFTAMPSHRLTCSSCRRFRFGCCMDF
jgi:hypothetical protein